MAWNAASAPPWWARAAHLACHDARTTPPHSRAPVALACHHRCALLASPRHQQVQVPGDLPASPGPMLSSPHDVQPPAAATAPAGEVRACVLRVEAVHACGSGGTAMQAPHPAAGAWAGSQAGSAAGDHIRRCAATHAAPSPGGCLHLLGGSCSWGRQQSNAAWTMSSGTELTTPAAAPTTRSVRRSSCCPHCLPPPCARTTSQAPAPRCRVLGVSLPAALTTPSPWKA